MLEYFVFNFETIESPELLTTALNLFAKEGWRVICNTIHGLVLEREKRPIIVEAEGSTTITYNWPTSQEQSHDSE